MRSYTLSGETDADIEDIAKHSLQRWGVSRAEACVLGPYETFRRLAEFPELGRDAGHIRPGIRKMEAVATPFFGRKIEGGVLIVRALHQPMNFEPHL